MAKVIDNKCMKCCRTCLKYFPINMHDLYTENNKMISIVSEMLMSCTTIQINPEDKLPDKLCNDCYVCISNFYNFRREAEAIDIQLRHQLLTSQWSCDKSNSLMIKFETENSTDTTTEYIIGNHSEFENSPLCTVQSDGIENEHLDNKNDELINNLENIGCSKDSGFKCEVCFKIFASVNSLSAHKKIHVKKGRVLSCKHCSKIFKKISHLKRHLITHEFKTALNPSYILKDSKSNPCPQCPKTFVHLSTLKNHMKQHSEEISYLCPICGKNFSSGSNLKQHINRHTDSRKFPCDQCNKHFKSKGELKIHCIKHTGERKFECNICKKTFMYQRVLAKHNKIHLGLKPHQCNVCSKKFFTKSHLDRHNRIHTGERPYQCQTCEKRFTQNNDLVKHKKLHLGVNMYSCNKCEVKFRLKTQLNRHLLKQHNKEKTNIKSEDEENVLKE